MNFRELISAQFLKKVVQQFYIYTTESRKDEQKFLKIDFILFGTPRPNRLLIKVNEPTLLTSQYQNIPYK